LIFAARLGTPINLLFVDAMLPGVNRPARAISAVTALGLAFKQQPTTDIAKEATQLVWLGLALTALSGTLMFIATPKLYFYNPAFQLKMGLFLVAVIVQLALFRKAAKQTTPSPAFARASVSISLAAWFSVAMAGRMIGFI
jgi:hypothetical protein